MWNPKSISSILISSHLVPFQMENMQFWWEAQMQTMHSLKWERVNAAVSLENNSNMDVIYAVATNLQIACVTYYRQNTKYNAKLQSSPIFDVKQLILMHANDVPFSEYCIYSNACP